MSGEKTASNLSSPDRPDKEEDEVYSPLVPRKRSLAPHIGTFTIQCAKCLQWRIIPTQERYEAFREHIAEEPFLCTRAKEWNPKVSCDEPSDITHDGSRVWAVDKPNIPRAPHGWERLLRFRYSASSKFADVHYIAPCGTRLRSMVQLQRYLDENPHFKDQGITKAQFSFQIPKRFDEDCVTKPSAASDNEIAEATEVTSKPLGSSSKAFTESPESAETQASKKRKASLEKSGKNICGK